MNINYSLPANENHFKDWMNEHNETYQIRVLAKSLCYVKKFEVAVDIGAHVGLLTVPLSKFFTQVYSFEPDETNFKLLYQNIVHHRCSNVDSYEAILWSEKTNVNWNVSDHSGGHYVSKEIHSSLLRETIPLDDFNLATCDFIKIDTQGAEYEILKGATATIQSCHPVIVVEDLERKFVPKYLDKLDYRLHAHWKKDYIYTWRGYR